MLNRMLVIVALVANPIGAVFADTVLSEGKLTGKIPDGFASFWSENRRGAGQFDATVAADGSDILIVQAYSETLDPGSGEQLSCGAYREFPISAVQVKSTGSTMTVAFEFGDTECWRATPEDPAGHAVVVPDYRFAGTFTVQSGVLTWSETRVGRTVFTTRYWCYGDAVCTWEEWLAGSMTVSSAVFEGTFGHFEAWTGDASFQRRTGQSGYTLTRSP